MIHANYLTAPNDQHVMLAGARLARTLGRTPPFQDLVLEELAPPPELEDEAGLLAFLRATASTVYHPCGTCRMGSGEGAVLDASLRLRGIGGLRVADASAFPLIPSSNIQPAVMMLAERAAAMIRGGR